MDKKTFTRIVRHFSESSAEEAQEILSLKQRYPYSQLLHALSARVSKDHGFSNHSTELQLAAVYAADRGVLKDVITAVDNHLASNPAITAIADTNTTSTNSVKRSEDSPNLAETVIQDLKQLNRSRHNFELVLSDFLSHTANEPGVRKEVITVSATEDPIEKIAQHLKETPGLSKKQRIVALAKAADALAEAEARENQSEEEPGKKKAETGDGLIDEIVNNKQEIDPETEKQKQQIQIIDQFIKAQPSISSAKEKTHVASPPTDLSTIKSGEFGDNIVSETLVDILLKQGKKDKAIEVLKKLIWKFPQKKAYFAAQIEDLKK